MITLFNIRPKGHNIGNDAISVALRNQLYKSFGRMVNIIDVPATSLYEAHSKSGLSSKTVYEINRVGDGVIVGGGNLYENNEIDFNETALKALQVPLMLFSNSLGKVYNRQGELVQRTDVIPDNKLATLHEHANISLVRDSSTLNHLKSIGVKNAKLGGCPTIYLGKYANYEHLLPKNDFIGTLISIRTPSLINLPQKHQIALTDELAKIIEFLKGKGHKRIRLLCNDSRDCEYASYFRDIANIDFVYTSNVFDYFALLSKADLVVSFRLHASLPSISFGTPIINISYDERAEQLFEDLGLGNWDIKYTKVESLSNEVSKRYQNLSQLKTILEIAKPIWDEIYDIQNNAFNEFHKLVRSNMIKRGIIKA
jgi:polysaccharide pyruvyl transferase WcaK-like protein